MDIGGDAGSVTAPRRRGRRGRRFGSVLGLESRDIGAHGGIAPAALQELTHSSAGIAEQRLVDKLDRRRRALDVEEDGADACQRDAARSGMYAGPMQSGW